MKLKPNSNKSMTNVLDEGFHTFLQNLNCVKIGRIESFDMATQTASVKIMHKYVNENNITTTELLEYPLLENVPVVILGGGTARITFPITLGDSCLILFNDYELDNWYNTEEPNPSTFPRKHDLSDAIAIVGLKSSISAIQDYSNYLQLYYNENSNITIGESVSINNEQTNISGNLTVNQAIVGNTTATAELHSTHGATGTFTNVSGQTLTIVDGIITNIS